MNGVLFVWLCLASWLPLATAQDYTCSATKPCALGCCSNTGVCGLGPDFCGDTCISNCDSKSECNPGWGMEVGRPYGRGYHQDAHPVSGRKPTNAP
jgi:chitinase